MSTRPPLLHIGFHKTATSLLQARLFVPEFGFEPVTDERRRVHPCFILPDALAPPPAALVAEMQDEASAAGARGRALVVSHERLSGYPASGGFDQGLIAERLHHVFPNGRVLMLIREQRAMIYSMYLQTISDGGTLGLRRFLEPPEPNLLRRPGFRPGFWNYDRVIRKYHALFGAENVLVLPFEQLRGDADGLARRIIDFSGGDPGCWREGILAESVNEGRPLAFQALRRRLNMLTRNQLSENGLVTVPVTHVERGVQAILPAARLLRPLDGILKRRLRDRIARYCEGRYAESNRATAALTGIDLAALGYEV